MKCNKKTYLNKNKYDGEMNIEGERHGKGTMIFSCGSVYNGLWDKNIISGRGTYTQSSKLYDPKIYHGIWNSLYNKFIGTVYYLDGTQFFGSISYTSDFTTMTKEGYGKMIYPDGEQYFGNWENDYMSGKGTYIWADNTKYIGDFKEGKSHGIGTFISSDYVYTGEWINDKHHGIGKLATNNSLYTGEFEYGYKSGMGHKMYYSGDEYKGEFRHLTDYEIYENT